MSVQRDTVARRAVYPVAAVLGLVVLVPAMPGVGLPTSGGGSDAGPASRPDAGPFEAHLTVIAPGLTPAAGQITQPRGQTVFITCPHDGQVLSGRYELPPGNLGLVTGELSTDARRWTFTHSDPVPVGTRYHALCAP